MNARYWEERSIALENLIQERNNESIKRVGRLFDGSFLRFEKEMQNILGRYSDKTGLSQEDAYKLLTTKQTSEERKHLLDLYNSITDAKYKKEILNRLEAPAYASRISNIEALRNLVYCEALAAGYQTKLELTKRMYDSYQESYYRATYNLQQATGAAYDFRVLTNNQVKAAVATEWKGSNYSQRIWLDTKALAQELEQIIPKGFMTGESVGRMTMELEKTMNKGRYYTSRVIRTEVAHVAGQGRKIAYDEAEIKRYIYIATLDLRTSEICRSLDGQVFLLKDAKVGVNYPPMHPFCRSCEGAYTTEKERENLKRRGTDPVTGKSILVPQTMKYQEWYDKYVKGRAEWQEKATRNKATDKKQFENYKKALGKKAPKTFYDYQKMKYTDSKGYEALKKAYRTK